MAKLAKSSAAPSPCCGHTRAGPPAVQEGVRYHWSSTGSQKQREREGRMNPPVVGRLRVTSATDSPRDLLVSCPLRPPRRLHQVLPQLLVAGSLPLTCALLPRHGRDQGWLSWDGSGFAQPSPSLPELMAPTALPGRAVQPWASQEIQTQLPAQLTTDGGALDTHHHLGHPASPRTPSESTGERLRSGSASPTRPCTHGPAIDRISFQLLSPERPRLARKG